MTDQQFEILTNSLMLLNSTVISMFSVLTQNKGGVHDEQLNKVISNAHDVLNQIEKYKESK